MWDYFKLIAFGLIAVLAAIGANYARDPAYLVNALTVMLVAGGMFLYSVRKVGEPVAQTNANEYFDGVVRAGSSPPLSGVSLGFWSVFSSLFSWHFRR